MSAPLTDNVPAGEEAEIADQPLDEESPELQDQPLDREVEKPQDDQEKAIPYSRFKEVNEDNKALKAEIEALRAQVAETPKPEEKKEPISELPPEGEKLVQIAKERILAEIREAAEKEEKMQAEYEKQADQKIQELQDHFGGEIPQTFKEFYKKQIDRYPTATVDGILQDYEDRGLNVQTPTKSRVTNPTKKGEVPQGVPKINRNEDFVTAARRAAKERGVI